MNIIRKTIAAMTGFVLSLGLALPVAALNVDGTANTATEGTVSVGNAGAGASADVNVGVGAGAESSGSTSNDSAQASGSADASATTEANAGVTIQPLVITRIEVDAGTVQATALSPSAVTTRAALSGYIAAEMKADKGISSVEAAADSVSLAYKQAAKLFGFIPVTVNATATVDASGNVTVSYPWYAFLMATNKADLEARIEERVETALGANVSGNASAQGTLAANAGKNGIVSGNASATGTAQANANANATTTAEAAAQLSAEAQAKVIAAVKAAMQAQLEAELNASANGNVSVI